MMNGMKLQNPTLSIIVITILTVSNSLTFDLLEHQEQHVYISKLTCNGFTTR